VDHFGGVPHDAAQHILQIFLGVDSQISAGLHQRQDGGGRAAAILTADKEPVLAANGEGAQAPLGNVVV